MEEKTVVIEENQNGKKKIKGLPSTIVSGIFILISLICLGIAYSINLGNIIKDMTAGKSGGEAAGAAIGAIFVVLIVILLILALLVLPAVLSIPSLILSIKNIKREIKALKILGIVFTVLSALIMIGVVLRIILLFTNVL